MGSGAGARRLQPKRQVRVGRVSRVGRVGRVGQVDRAGRVGSGTGARRLQPSEASTGSQFGIVNQEFGMRVRVPIGDGLKTVPTKEREI
ncbi:MAG: hypothetical protein DMF95_16470 [Acidobacteria bacterium]|nr:MAG: hypothetical protein DMF94_31570 [Acidobacteriota bacterium]PYR47394.1 MAG: hypothetical protein DMF95_16470 [Acidobacteriota bacterium]